MSLSSNKEVFLKERKAYIDSTQLLPQDLLSISSHYAEKFGIKIIPNGTTSAGKEILQKKHQILSVVYERLNNKKTSLAACIIYIGQKNPNLEQGILSFLYSKSLSMPEDKSGSLSKAISRFCQELSIKELANKHSFSEEELIQFNDICLEVLPADYQQAILAKIDNYQKNIQAKMLNLGLSKKEAIQEVSFIQENMKEEKQAAPLGYIFTNEKTSEIAHFETLIVCQDYVVKPVIWGEDDYKPEEIYDETFIYPKEFSCDSYSPYLDSFLINKSQLLFIPSAQADGRGCAALGILWVKELLKPRGLDCPPLFLGQTDLLFQYYDSDENLKGFYLPPPDGLRYSQSSTYIKLLYEIINYSKDDEITVSRNTGDILRFRSLEAVLDQSLSVAKKKNNQRVIEKNQVLLDNLPNFRRLWNAKYSEIRERRDKMYYSYINNYNETHRYHGWLVYRSQKMKAIGTKSGAQSLLPPSSFLPTSSSILDLPVTKPTRTSSLTKVNDTSNGGTSGSQLEDPTISKTVSPLSTYEKFKKWYNSLKRWQQAVFCGGVTLLSVGALIGMASGIGIAVVGIGAVSAVFVAATIGLTGAAGAGTAGAIAAEIAFDTVGAAALISASTALHLRFRSKPIDNNNNVGQQENNGQVGREKAPQGLIQPSHGKSVAALCELLF